MIEISNFMLCVDKKKKKGGVSNVILKNMLIMKKKPMYMYSSWVA